MPTVAVVSFCIAAEMDVLDALDGHLRMKHCKELH